MSLDEIYSTAVRVRSGMLSSLPNMQLQDASLVVISSGLIAHFIFNRWEPLRVSIVLPLLVFIPTVLSTLFLRNVSAATSLLLSFSLYHTTLLTSIVLYRLSPFHPLGKFPGPLPAKISKLWHLQYVASGKQHLYLSRMHEKYGDIVRFGPNEVSIRDASCIKPMLGTAGLTKGPSWAGRTMYTGPPALIAYRDPVAHAKRRRPWNRAFNTSSLKEFHPVIANRSRQLVEHLKAQKGQVVNLQRWFSFFTYDLMGDMAFGGWTEMMRDGADTEGLWELVKAGLDTAFLFEHVPWIAYYVKLLPWVGKDLRRMRAMGAARAAQRFDHGSNAKDLFYFLSNEDNSEPVSPPRHTVVSDGVLAIVAGADTTTSVICNVIWAILQRPEMYKRLQEEVDKFYPSSEDSLDGRHLNEMHYLEAVINETLRLWPAVLSGGQRAPEIGKGGKIVGPYYIPEGNQARMHLWSVHRDPRSFTYPDTFWPDRWLIAEGLQESREKIKHNPDAFIPFSFGPANCVGKNLAMLEMRLVLCHMFQKLTFRFTDGYDPQQWDEEREDKFAQKLGDLPVIVSVRD